MAAGSVIGVAGAAFGTVGGFLFVLAATRGLGAAGSGSLFVAIALFTVLGNVGKLGTDTSLVRFVASALATGRAAQVRWLLRVALVASAAASLLIAGVLMVGAETLAGVVYSGPAEPGQTRLLVLSAAFLPLMTLTLVLLAVTRGFGSVVWFVSVEQLLKPISRPVVVAVICWFGGGAVAAMLGWLAPVALGLLLAAYAARRCLAGAPTDTLVETGPALTGREFWGFAAPRAVGGTLEILAPWLGVLLLSSLASTADAGVFTAVARVVTAGTMVLVAMRLALGPHLSAAFAREDREALSRLHEHSTVWAVLISLPMLWSFVVFPEAVLSVFGPAFPAGATALVVVSLANLVNVAVGNVQSVVLMGGRSSWNLLNTAVALVAQLGLGALLIPRHGLVGAAIGLAAGVVANNALSTWQVGRGLGLRVVTPRIVRAGLVTTLVFVPLQLAGRVTLGPSLAVLFGSTLVCAGLMLVVVWWRPRWFDLAGGWAVLTRRFDVRRDAA